MADKTRSDSGRGTDQARNVRSRADDAKFREADGEVYVGGVKTGSEMKSQRDGINP